MQGVVKGTSPTLTVVVWAVFSSIWLGMTGLMTALAWDQIRKEAGLVVFMGLFWLAGLFLAAMAVKAVLHARRFGSSCLILDTPPPRLGGWLSGVIQAPPSVHGAEVQVMVQCVRTTHGRGTNSSTSTWTMWRATKVLDGARCDRRADRVEIPFAVRLPTNEEATREQNDNVLAAVLGEAQVDLLGPDMSWHVGVSARLKGVDYSDRFAVPVAPAEGVAPAADRPPRAMPELAGERLAARLPGRVEYRPDADVLVFPLKPSWVVWTLALGAVALLPLFGGVPALAGLPPGLLKWGAIVGGVLAVLCLLGLMLDTRSIEIAPAAVRIRRGVLGLGFHRTIPRTEIANVEEEPSRSEPPTYSVNIRLHDGTSYWAAVALREPDQAAALATRLRQILQLSPRS
jgi:hypothetical protein